ncbi:hypothetical protein I315_05663 [Cryptococcus gattii Ru294]|nr:hypothetical protein I315_05663 [Cryptococcus gattii Ru294]
MVTRSYTSYAFIKRISSVTCATTTSTTKSIKWLNNDTTFLVYLAFSVRPTQYPLSPLVNVGGGSLLLRSCPRSLTGMSCHRSPMINQ